MKTKSLLFIFFVFFILSGCNVAKEIGGAYNMTQCKYDYKSISSLRLSGMDLSNGISVTYIPKLTSILTGNASSIPLDFTLNLNVTNPNQAAAMLYGLQYIVSVDNIDFTTGSLNQSLNIPAGDTQVLPVNIGVDLATLMKNNSKSSIEKIAKNFIGLSSDKSNVTVQLKPSFMIGGQVITSPSYIPVSFSFGGK